MNSDLLEQAREQQERQQQRGPGGLPPPGSGGALLDSQALLAVARWAGGLVCA